MLPWIIAGVILLILIFWFAGTYNHLISLNVRVDNGWSQVDVQLKKRFDLIPSLVETVKGYAAHESKTLEQVTKWRSAAANAKTPEDAMAANKELSQAIVHLFATAEQYPDLKANQNFISLQQQLEDIETRIAISRQFYNDTTMRYNEGILHFPSNVVASVFHFRSRPYYEVETSEKAAPQVRF